MTALTSKYGVLMVGPLPPLADEQAGIKSTNNRKSLKPGSLGGQAVLVANLVASRLTQQYRFEVLDVNHAALGAFQRLSLGLQFVFQLAIKLISDPQLTLIHIHTSAGIALLEKSTFMLVSRIFRRNVLLHIHGGQFRELWRRSGGIQKSIIRTALGLSHGIILLGDSWIQFYRDEIGYKGKLFSLPNSVQVVSLKSVNKIDKVCILFVGHLKREKGLLDLFAALSLFSQDELSQIEVFLMGKGDNEDNELEIRGAYNRTGLNCVHFLGMLGGDAKWKAFAEADIFVLPSHSEDMPLSILEAMALGKPIIASNVGGVSSVVRDGIDGFIVSSQDVLALHHAIRNLAFDVDLIMKMGCAAQNNFEQNFSFFNYENKLEKIYQELLFEDNPQLR